MRYGVNEYLDEDPEKVCHDFTIQPFRSLFTGVAMSIYWAVSFTGDVLHSSSSEFKNLCRRILCKLPPFSTRNRQIIMCRD